MIDLICLASLFFILCQNILAQGIPNNPLGPPPEQRQLSPSGDRNRQFTYFQAGDANSAHVIIAIHGITRDAEATCRHFRTAKEASRRGAALIICPLFDVRESGQAQGISNNNNGNRVFWASPDSYANLDPAFNAADVNPITIVEDLLERTISTQTRTVTIAGFGEGAQLVQKIALFADFPDLLPQIPIRFIMLSPGRFVYPTAHRLSPQLLLQMNENTDPFLINSVNPNMFLQESLPDCRISYNQYGYGLGLNRSLAPSHFATRFLADQPFHQSAMNRYSSRSMLLISDISDRALTGSLDRSCEANSQGPNRIWRALLYHRLLSLFSVGLPFLVVQQTPCGHQIDCLLRNDTVQSLVFDSASLAFNTNSRM